VDLLLGRLGNFPHALFLCDSLIEPMLLGWSNQ